MKPAKLLIVAFILFGSSAGVSWYLQSKMKKPQDDAKAKHDPGNEKVLKEPDLSHAPPKKEPKDDSHGKPASLYIPGSENLTEYASILKAQMDAIKTKEKQLSVRQKNLEAIYEDIKKERSGLDELRQKIADEVKVLNEKIDVLEKRAIDTKSERQKIVDNTKELKQTLLEVDDAEKARIIQMAKVVEAMPPDAAGRTLMALAEGGKVDMAVKVIASMKEGKTAKILAETGDEGFTALMLERLKGLKAIAKAKD
jgi:flagellar motility protein MotE (MotC chaperone)